MADKQQKPEASPPVDYPKDPTQRMPPPVQRGDRSDQAVRDQQHTGNHDKPGREAHGADDRGGTRAGAENVEPRT